VDEDVTNGQTYYYTVTAFAPVIGKESPQSAEVSATPRFATTSTALSDAVLSAGPVAYWRFSKSTGIIAHDSAGPFDGEYGSSVGLGAPGPRPSDFLGFELTNLAARFFNNPNDPNTPDDSFVIIPALNLNTNQVTIACWIYPMRDEADFTGLIFCRNYPWTVAGLN
jgi:hypothetical protein